MGKKALVLSGGASKGAFTAGVMKYILRDGGMDGQFDFAIGTSTGSLVAGPALLHKGYNYLENIYTTVENEDVLTIGTFWKLIGIVADVPPINASLKPLKELLSKYYLDPGEGNLKKLRNNNKVLIACVVNVRTGCLQYVSSADEIKDETFINGIVASCSEPVYTEPVRIFEQEVGHPNRDDIFYDGGVKEFLPLEKAVDEGADEIWAVSTHPLTTEPTHWGGGTEPNKVGLDKALGWAVNSALNEVERGDLFRGYAYSRQGWAKDEIERIVGSMNIGDNDIMRLREVCDNIFPGKKPLAKLRVLIPPEPMPTSLEFDPAIMQNYFAEGRRTAKRFFKNGKPLFAANDWLLSRLNQSRVYDPGD